MSDRDFCHTQETDFRDLKRCKPGNRVTSQILLGEIKAPTLQITIPSSVLGAESPQELVYNILINDKIVYTKQELLFVMGKLHQMINPKFGGDCTYIS